MWIEIVGWMGMVLLLANFYLASHRHLNDRHYPYHILNLVGAVGVMINAFSKGVLAVGFVEVAWSLIALVGVCNVYRFARAPLMRGRSLKSGGDSALPPDHPPSGGYLGEPPS